MEVNVLKLSNSKASLKRRYENFFNYGESKGIQTVQF